MRSSTTPLPSGSTRAGSGGRLRRAWPIAAGIVVVGALVVILGPSGSGPALDPDSAGGDGLLGLVRLLEALDVEVEVSLEPPADTDVTVFVPLDLLGEERRQRFLDWARSGGTLVVAGHQTRFHDREDVGTPLEEMFAPAERTARCDAAELEVVGEVRHDGWRDLGDDDGDVRCFPSADGGGWLLLTDLGAGRLTILGSADPFTNAWLGQADNAVLAAAIFGRAPGDVLQIVPRAPAGERDVGLLDLVAPGVWRALFLLTIAVVILVVARSRRLGSPVEERLPPVLPSGELARSLAGLTARAGDRQGAAARLRSRARQRATSILGLPANADDQLIIDRLTTVTTVPVEDADRALRDRQVTDDAALVDVARAVAIVLDRLEHPTATTTATDPPGAPTDPPGPPTDAQPPPTDPHGPARSPANSEQL